MSDPDLTIGAIPTVGATPTPATPATSRLAPGSIVVGRYRLVALLGRGGMGEVYRADDLTLDQPVALKFLPEAVGADAGKLAQFHNELRTARQVSHKNVVRLYDLGEADARRFLTMEYVDGEDLASLLRRIGRVPQDKAIELARQLCAGVAAAHERGVLHRDLKPANVMIDGDGNVRITDFGIATSERAGSALNSGMAFAGTPQYMAPEQLAGQPATVATDIYALGLVLFEIFTGRRAYDAKTLSDLKQLHDTGTVTSPSSVVRDLDPTVERVIMRCLEKDPHKRPGSALAVAAALPGGDPLAAALAAGETPSPEMLAAAGEAEALPVAVAFGIVAAVAAALALFVALAPGAGVAGLVPLDKPPAVLADRAEQVIASLGYTDEPVDRTFGVASAGDYLRWIERTDKSPRRWDQLRAGRPSAVLFWYRTSPRDLIPLRALSGVSPTDPAEDITNMRSVILDGRGRLMEFHAVPPQLDNTPSGAPAPAWQKLFDAAGLDMAAFASVEPQWTPHNFADTRAAWEGQYGDGQPTTTVRVEAAAYRGRPVSFLIVGPWSRASRMTVVSRTTAQTVLSSLNFIAWTSCLVVAGVFARRNVRANRADRRGARRLGAFLIATLCVAWIAQTHHTASANTELEQFFATAGFMAYLGGAIWVMYLAIEPYARRLWPDGLLGWTRLLAGHVRDPRVGRDVLTGSIVGAACFLIELARIRLPPIVGSPMPRPILGDNLNMLLGPLQVAAQIGNWLYGPIQTALFVALLFVGLRFLLRRGWAAAIATVAVVLAVGDGGRPLVDGIGLQTLLYTLLYSTIVFAVVRFGLLAASAGLVIDNMITSVPVPPHLSSWSAAAADTTIIVVLGVLAFAFYAARAGQPLFGTAASDQ